MNALKHELLDNGCCFSYSSLNNSKQILFLDRDGVINKDTGYVHKITDLELLEKNILSLIKLKKKYQFIVITNQSGIDRGFFNWDDYINFTNYLYAELRKHGVTILSFIATSYHKDFSTSSISKDWRKPNTKSIDFLEKKYLFTREKSYFIGDKETDIEFASNANFKGAFLLKSDILENDLCKLKSNYKYLKDINITNEIEANRL